MLRPRHDSSPGLDVSGMVAGYPSERTDMFCAACWGTAPASRCRAPRRMVIVAADQLSRRSMVLLVAAVGDDCLKLADLDLGVGGDLLGHHAGTSAAGPDDVPVAGGGDGVRHTRLVFAGVLVAVTAGG